MTIKYRVVENTHRNGIVTYQVQVCTGFTQSWNDVSTCDSLETAQEIYNNAMKALTERRGKEIISSKVLAP